MYKQITVIQFINKLKTKILLIDVEDAFHKAQHPFEMKVSKKQRIKTTYLSVMWVQKAKLKPQRHYCLMRKK